MRILQLAQKPQRRGAEVFAHQLTHELQARGHDVRLRFLYPFTGPGGLPYSRSQMLDGRERSVLEKLPGVDPRLARRVLHEIDDFQPDIVQANGARTVKYAASAALARRARTWALVYRNIGNPRDWVATPIHKAFYRRIVMPQLDGVVGVSQATLDAVRDFYALSIPMTHIPRGVDPAALTPTGSPDALRAALGLCADDRVLVYVGSLSPEKRLDRLLAALPPLVVEFPSLHVWIVGDGPLREELQSLANRLDLRHTVHFLGAQDRVGDYLNAADLFALTSDTEGMPGVLLEAGYMGLPVVATDVGGVAECVVDGETGILVPARDDATAVTALTAALARLLRDPALRERMGENARTLVAERFTLDNIAAAQYLAFYRTFAPTRERWRASLISQDYTFVRMCVSAAQCMFPSGRVTHNFLLCNAESRRRDANSPPYGLHVLSVPDSAGNAVGGHLTRSHR